MVVVPINVDPGSGDQLLSLHDAYALGGEEELRADLESAINLTIDYSKVMTADEFAAFLDGLPAMQVDLPRDVLGADDAVLYPKGPTALTADQAARDHHQRVADRARATAPARTSTRCGAAIAAAIGTGRRARRSAPPSPTTFDEMATRLTAGPVAARGLVARPLDSRSQPGRARRRGARPPRHDPGVRQHRSGVDDPAGQWPVVPHRGAARLRPAGPQDDRRPAGVRRQRGVGRSQRRAAAPRPRSSLYDPALAAAEPTDNAVFGTDHGRDPRRSHSAAST